MARLKTFVWSDGLTEYAVATTSRPKALAAWDSDIDLFKTGLASETEEAALVEAAQARPGEVVARPVKGGPAKALQAAKASPRRKASSAAEKKVEAARKALGALEVKQDAELTALEARLSAIEREREAMRARHEKARASAKAKLDAAREALAGA